MNRSSRPRRRDVLKGAGAGAALLAGLGARPRLALASASPGGLASLQRELTGRLILPGEEGYLLAAMPRAARWEAVLPKAVARCADAADVRRCIVWARDNGEAFAIRSGGHNYAGFSTTTGLLIDLGSMSRVSFDPKSGTATVEGGANNENVARAFRRTGLAIPSGRCPTVGVAGLTLGGGWGLSAVHFGLTCDSLVASDIALADGRLATADASGDHRDLFWALRGGGGGNFGVNTSLTFRLHEVGDVTWFNILWPGRKHAELFAAIQDLQLANPTTISTRTKVVPEHAGARPPRGALQVTTLGLYFGGEREAREVLAPALGLVEPSSAVMHTVDYWEARDVMATDDPNGLYELQARFVGDRLGAEGVETMLDWMTKWPGGSRRPENMGMLYAIGGRVRDIAPADTAFVHRRSNFIFSMESNWDPIDGPEVVAAQAAWLGGYFEAMQPFLLPQSYVNFPNRRLADWASAYYGGNLSRLSAVKRQYDPDNIFRFPQSIPPA
jgi:FAD/FMN-containing dehydrogenase